MKIKNLAVLPLMLALAFALLSGCAAAPGGTANKPSSGSIDKPSEIIENSDLKLLSLQKEIRDNACPAGMAFLGFVTEDAAESDLRSFLKDSQYEEKYAFLADAPFVDAGGTELYAVVTAEKECCSSVYRAEINDSGEYDVQTDEALYEEDGPGCFLLRCNVSDIHANAAVSFRTGDDIFSVFPMLSGMDGHLVAEGCYDFSLYAEDNHAPDDDVIIAYGLLSEADEVQYYMGLGMTLQYTGQTQIIDGRSCWIFALGTQHDDGQFVREYLYGVCDNLIYAYDAPSDTWSVLGAG